MLKIQKKDNRKAGKQGKQGIQGIQGKPGKDGLNGIDGTKWFNGDGKPSVSLGENGDFYLDDITSDYYQKIKDKWVLQGNLKGKKGDKGDKGERGDKGAKGDRGRDGGVGSPGADGAQGPQGETGAQGAQGNPGLNGEGVALGGTTGQILAKNSNTNFDTGWIDQPSGGGLAIGQTITNSPTVRGLLYSDDTDTLQNNLISIQQDSFFGGMVTADSFATETYSGFPSFGWVDATGFGQPGAVGVLTPGVNAQFYMMIDTTTLSAKAALNYNPGTPANSYFTIALANGLGGTPELNVNTSGVNVYQPLNTYNGEIYSIGDGQYLDFYSAAATTSGSYGGDFNFNAGNGLGAGYGGSFYVNSGTGGATGQGGIISMLGGTGGVTSGDGGSVDIGGGYAGGSGDGGNLTLWGGDGTGGGTHGSIRFRYNGSTSATNGDVWELQDAATGAGAWATPAGGGIDMGDVIGNSPVDNALLYTNSSDQLANDSDLTWNGTRLVSTAGYRMNAGSSNTIGDVDGNGSIYFDGNSAHIYGYSYVNLRDGTGQYAALSRGGATWEATPVDTGPFGGGNYDAKMIFSGGEVTVYDTKAFGNYFGGKTKATANGDKLYGVVFRPQFNVGSYTGLTLISSIFVSGNAGSIGTVIKGASSQSANLLQLRNSSDTVLASFGSGGNLGIGGAATTTSKLNIQSIPTSSAGLATGDVWSNGGVLTIV